MELRRGIADSLIILDDVEQVGGQAAAKGIVKARDAGREKRGVDASFLEGLAVRARVRATVRTGGRPKQHAEGPHLSGAGKRHIGKKPRQLYACWSISWPRPRFLVPCSPLLSSAIGPASLGWPQSQGPGMPVVRAW